MAANLERQAHDHPRPYERLRIALVTENFLPKLDGVTRTLAMLLEHLRTRGHQAIVLGPEGAPDHYAGFPIFPAQGIPLPFYPELRALIPSAAVHDHLARFRPNIVHVADPVLLGAAGVRWARASATPLVASYHTNLAAYCAHYHLGALQRLVWAYRRRLHNQCDATLCPSPSTACALAQRGFTNVELWPRGVDHQLFSPVHRSQTWRDEVASEAVQTVLLYVGRLSQEKNLGALVAAYRAVQSDATHLVVVGDGPARPELERALTNCRVTFTGYLTGVALAQVYASSDVFVFPSLTETFGQVVLEAMASGLPVAGFAAEGVCDLVTEGQTGFLSLAGDLQAFAQSLRTLIDAPRLRLALGRSAREAALRRAWPSVMDGLLDTYYAVIMREAFGAA